MIRGGVMINNMEKWASYRERLQREAKKNLVPDSGTFELTPLCNFNCKMCYVHLKPEEMKLQGRLRTKKEWISLAKELKEKGKIVRKGAKKGGYWEVK